MEDGTKDTAEQIQDAQEHDCFVKMISPTSLTITLFGDEKYNYFRDSKGDWVLTVVRGNQEVQIDEPWF